MKEGRSRQKKKRKKEKRCTSDGAVDQARVERMQLFKAQTHGG